MLRVDGWICVTKNQKRALHDILGNDTRITVVSQGVDTCFFDPDLADKMENGLPYILSVGAEMRDYPLLFEATRELEIDVVVKSSSRWMKGARERIGEVPRNVTLIDKRLTYDELRNLYAGATLVVVPLQDTMQAAGITTILEAMAMGRCVIATDSAGLPDILVDKSTGLIVASNASDLSVILSEALVMGDICQELAIRAYQTVREEASLEYYASAIATFIQSSIE